MLEGTLAALKRLEFLVLIGGWVRQPRVIKAGEYVPRYRRDALPSVPTKVAETSHINGEVEVTVVLIDVKAAKLLLQPCKSPLLLDSLIEVVHNLALRECFGQPGNTFSGDIGPPKVKISQ